MKIELLCRASLLMVAALILTDLPVIAGERGDQAEQVRLLLDRSCFECHGKNPRDIMADLDILNYSALTDLNRQIVVPNKPNESAILERVLESNDELRMPPAPHLRLTDDEVSLLRSWIAAGASQFDSAREAATAVIETPSQLAASVKEIFRVHCLSCHDKNQPTAGVQILSRESLIARRKIKPGDSDHSRVFQLITSENLVRRMPPEGKRPLSYSQIEQVRKWIAAGAPEFPPDVAIDTGHRSDNVGNEAVLSVIVAHQRALPQSERLHWRYFSANHLAAAGATREELALQHDALAKAINHLSWEAEIVPLTTVDAPFNSVFAVDIRRLGWHKRPYRVVGAGNELGGEAKVTIYDLALLEYPYAYVPLDSASFDVLAREFIMPAGLARPIPYLRSDWFVSIVTQSALYHDFLQLPLELKELQQKLGVDVAKSIPLSAGMTVSGVSKNNRVVQYFLSRDGSFWASIDFSASKGVQNMFQDPVNLHGVGGEFVFTLPNGLNGYYLANAAGQRLDAAPTEIVTDKFAEDRVVRNGLSCMRCHDEGVKSFTDTVRPAIEKLPGLLPFDKVAALELYRPAQEMDQRLQVDRDRFLKAVGLAMGKAQTVEPLIAVSHRYLDEDLPLSIAAGELGLTESETLAPMFRLPQFASLGLVSLGAPGGSIRRDTWEDHFPQVVRDIGIGVPIVPLDGLTRDEFPSTVPPFDVDISTNKANNLFQPGERAFIVINNRSPLPLFARLIFTGTKAEKLKVEMKIEAGAIVRFPEKDDLRVQSSLGQEKITFLVSDRPLPPVETVRGSNMSDRIIHPFFRLAEREGRIRVEFDVERVVKRTLEIETR